MGFAMPKVSVSQASHTTTTSTLCLSLKDDQCVSLPYYACTRRNRKRGRVLAHDVLSVVQLHGYNELGEQTMEQYAPVSNFNFKCHLVMAVECKRVEGPLFIMRKECFL